MQEPLRYVREAICSLRCHCVSPDVIKPGGWAHTTGQQRDLHPSQNREPHGSTVLELRCVHSSILGVGGHGEKGPACTAVARGQQLKLVARAVCVHTCGHRYVKPGASERIFSTLSLSSWRSLRNPSVRILKMAQEHASQHWMEMGNLLRCHKLEKKILSCLLKPVPWIKIIQFLGLK